MKQNLVDFDIRWAAFGGPATFPPGSEDPDAAIVYDVARRLKIAAAEAIGTIHAAGLNPELSDIGRMNAYRRAGTTALAMVAEYTGAEASRTALGKRLAAVQIPGLESIPAPLFGVLYAKLASHDPVTLVPAIRDWMKKGDLSPAVMLAQLPLSLSLVSRAQTASLMEDLRTALDAPGARAASALQAAVNALDAAGKVAVAMIREAAQLGTSDGGPVLS